MKFDPCEYCHSPVGTRRVPVGFRRWGKLCIFQNVPVGVCVKCGQRYFPGPILEQLDEITRRGTEGAPTIRVPTIGYREVG